MDEFFLLSIERQILCHSHRYIVDQLHSVFDRPKTKKLYGNYNVASTLFELTALFVVLSGQPQDPPLQGL